MTPKRRLLPQGPDERIDSTGTMPVRPRHPLHGPDQDAGTRSPIGAFTPGQPAGYPTELEVDVSLGDGRHVHVRPILPSDAPKLAAAIAGADAETLRLRFLGWQPILDDATLRHLVEVDYDRRLALVALDSVGGGVGVARYEGRPDEDVAEIAVAVDPDWRRRGLGFRLLSMLGAAAASRGIRQLVAFYFDGNRDVEGLVRSSGLPYRSLVSRGIVEARLDLPLLAPFDPPAPDGHVPA